jgi:transcriptional regulator with XRE-family HTH domain
MVITSQLIGLSPSALRKYERGEREPSLSALVLIADYYGVSLDYLAGKEK